MKSGSMFLIVVLLAVFAIPLFADPSLGNTVGEVSAMSINTQEELIIKDLKSPYGENIGIQPKPIPKLWIMLDHDKRSKRNVPAENSDKAYKYKNVAGGVRRIKSGRHKPKYTSTTKY